jgi:hypothetical protein
MPPSAPGPFWGVRYDPAKGQFLNDAEANTLLSRVTRRPWSLRG